MLLLARFYIVKNEVIVGAGTNQGLPITRPCESPNAIAGNCLRNFAGGRIQEPDPHVPSQSHSRAIRRPGHVGAWVAGKRVEQLTLIRVPDPHHLVASRRNQVFPLQCPNQPPTLFRVTLHRLEQFARFRLANAEGLVVTNCQTGAVRGPGQRDGRAVLEDFWSTFLLIAVKKQANIAAGDGL